jgi:hypothetical protein
MGLVSLVVACVGCAVSLGAAVWLLLGFQPSNPKYRDDGPLYPGRQVSLVVPRLLQDQCRASALVVVGATLQLFGAILAVAAA